MRPIGSGFDILIPIYGPEGFTLTGEPLPEVGISSGLSAQESAALLLKTAEEAGADYIIIEGIPLRVLVEMVTSRTSFEGRILAPSRGHLGQVFRFSTYLPELATKPFPEE